MTTKKFKALQKMNSDNLKLLNIVMALYEQELSSPLQDLCEIMQEPRDFDYCYNNGERVCYNCDLIDSKPMLITSPDNKSNYSHKAYFKKCIVLRENLNNCLIPYDIYENFKIFQRSFRQMFLNESKISVRYTLYQLVLFYDRPCLESTFINININKIKERYESLCDQIHRVNWVY